MKRLFSVLICLFAFLLAFSACTEKEPSEETKKDYLFQSGETAVRIDAEAKAILEALGPHLSYDESPSCAFEGMDKVYGYVGFEVETYCLKGVDYIAAIQLLDDSVQTPEGACIGMSAEDVRALYGEASEEKDGVLLYRAEGVILQFLLRDGRVTNIQYLKNTD